MGKPGDPQAGLCAGRAELEYFQGFFGEADGIIPGAELEEDLLRQFVADEGEEEGLVFRGGIGEIFFEADEMIEGIEPVDEGEGGGSAIGGGDARVGGGVAAGRCGGEGVGGLLCEACAYCLELEGFDVEAVVVHRLFGV
jgi:hypothetical protein